MNVYQDGGKDRKMQIFTFGYVVVKPKIYEGGGIHAEAIGTLIK